jgi:hypothetical protein
MLSTFNTCFYVQHRLLLVNFFFFSFRPDIVNDAKKLSDLLAQLTGSMAAGSMDAGQMLKLATSTEFGSSDILTRDKADIADVVIASQPQTFMGGRLVNPSRERDWGESLIFIFFSVLSLSF